MKMSKMTMQLVLILTIGTGLLSCTGSGKKAQVNKHAGVEYYRNLLFSETPYDIERGSHPVTPEEAKTINSYKFTYDDNGRLQTVEYVRNGVLLGYSSM
jgi:hypothetical protein